MMIKESRKKRMRRIVISRSVWLMVGCGVLLFIPLIMQLYRIQVTQHEFYRQKAVSRQTRNTELSAERGSIFDRNGRPLAVSISAETIFIAPNEISDEDAPAIAEGLSAIVGVSADVILSYAAKKDSAYAVIGRQVDKETADAVRRFRDENEELEGIYIEQDTKRHYPLGAVASHVIGFVQKTDGNGLQGLELGYDQELTGTPGRTVAIKDAFGAEMPFTDEQYYPEQDGRNLHLTLDESIQYILSKNLQAAVAEHGVQQRGAAIAVDVETGAVLGMAIEGGGEYDLNNPHAITDPEMIQSLAERTGDERDLLLREMQESIWRNKVVSDAYEPGSVFKIITAAIALEEGVIRPDDTFYCGGSIMVEGWDEPVSCWKAGGHGTQTFAEGIENSCNPVFIQVAQRIGAKTFSDYLEAFGLKEKTGVDLPGEGVGVTKSRSATTVLDLSMMGFGQTNSYTPIQMLRAVSAVANGGNLMTPHLVDYETDGAGNVVMRHNADPVRQVISEETSRRLCLMLEQVCITGTGKNAYVKGYRVAGKTGTSEKVPRGSDRYVVSFVGFAPADDPKVAVLVLLDEPGGPQETRSGGIMVAPVVGRILSEILPYLGVQAQYTEEELASGTVEFLVNSYRDMPVDDATKVLEEGNYRFRIEGDGSHVTDQIPSPGAFVPGTAQIVLYCGVEKPTEKVSVPDVVGLSYRQADTALLEAGFYMRAVGATGAATSASTVAARMFVSLETDALRVPGSVIEVEFIDGSVRD